MEQIAEQITQDLLRILPEKIDSLTPDELLSLGFPYMVVQTLRNDAAQSISSKLSIPEIDGIDPSDSEIRNAWEDFVDICRKQLVFPVSILKNTLSDVVVECLLLALQPRTSVPDNLFKTEDRIDIDSLRVRVESVIVNKHLGLAILRYAQKKEMNEITAEQARELVRKVDEKLIENYHPLNWAQALKPVFTLAGPSVDTELFEIFFNEKNKQIYAHRFGQMEQELNESELIEVLSSADFLEIDEQPQSFMGSGDEETVSLKQEKEIAHVKSDLDEDTAESEEEVFDEEESLEPEESVDDSESSEELATPSVQSSRSIEIVEDDDPEDDTSPEKGVEAEQVPPADVPEEEDLESQDEIEEENLELKEETEQEDLESEDEHQRDENIVDLFSDIREVNYSEDEHEEQVLSLVDDNDPEKSPKDSADENITLLNKFMFDEGGEPEADTENSEEPSSGESVPADSHEKSVPTSIYKEMNLVKGEYSDSQKNDSLFEDSSDKIEEDDEFELSYKIENQNDDPEKVEKDESVEENLEVTESDEGEKEVEDEEDQPMWRSFLERDDLEAEPGYEYDEDSETESTADAEVDEEEDFIEEPIYDFTTDEEETDEKIEKISNWLDDEKGRFIEEIFKGSEIAYEQALVEIIEFENWKSASEYLEKEVFSRNRVDVYDEAAVDFTDRLHSFFLEDNPK